MTPWHMGAEATACRLPAPALPTRSPCPTLGRPDAARRSTSALNVPPLPPVPPVPLRHDGTDHLPAQGFAYGSVGGASTFRGVQTARAGFRGLVCCAVPFKPVVERACKARASLPHPASTVGQAVLRSDIRAVVVPARDCVAATEGRSSPTAKNRRSVAYRVEIALYCSNLDRMCFVPWFTVDTYIIFQRKRRYVHARREHCRAGPWASGSSPRPARGANGSNASGRAEPAPQQACRFTTRDSDTAQIRS